MSRSRLWLLVVCPFALLVSLNATLARAQITGTPIEGSIQAGLMQPDSRAQVKTGPAYTGSLGWRFQPWFVIEGYALFAPSEQDTAPEGNHNFSTGGIDLRFNLRPAHERTVPFVFAGLGYGLSHTQGHLPDRLERGTPSFGLGSLFALRGSRTYLRLQVRDALFKERDSDEYSHHLAATAGLHFLWGGRPRDIDVDGVPDWRDRCPETPIGARVDANGCPLDQDADKVFDGLDRCEGTPAGCTVDANGCPTDADGDGVCDGLDRCADTPRGATADASGCPRDSDGDGVPDGLDQCPGTPSGTVVDSTGCVHDSDGDGVSDRVDKCPGTSAGLKVDSEGCPIEVTEKETELMDTGMIRLQNVNFETAKADLLPESLPVLDVVGQVLTKWPELKIEVGGHTDARGSNAYNQRLSEARVKSVLDYVLGKFSTLNREQFTSRGYGEARPIASNRTVEGMARNRRVEFVVLNKDVLKRETERRRLLRRDEPTPGTQPAPIPPTPAPSDTLLPPPPQMPDTLRAPAPPDTSSTPR
jgi:outer membrane protein OmpA-like peptidoglycan-associated protein